MCRMLPRHIEKDTHVADEQPIEQVGADPLDRLFVVRGNASCRGRRPDERQSKALDPALDREVVESEVRFGHRLTADGGPGLDSVTVAVAGHIELELEPGFLRTHRHSSTWATTGCS